VTHGPFESDRQAHAAAIAAIPPEGGRSILSRPQNRRLLEDACTAAGLEIGQFDRRILHWIAEFEDSTCVVIAGLIVRAHEAGKASAMEGAETQWGLRLTSDSGEPIFDPYPSEEIARNMIPTFQGVFDTVVVRRELGPWKEAPDA
jgi:hypothetical protein